MADVKIPISADFDGGDINKVVQQFSEQMNRLARSVAEANKVKFEPIDKASVDDMKMIVAQFENLKKISAGLNQRLKTTGQGSAGLFDVDFHKLYEDKRVGDRKALDVLQYVTSGTSIGPKMPKAGAEPPPRQPLNQPPGSPGTSGWGGVGMSVFNAAAGAAGGGGRVVGNAVNAGMSGGMRAGMFGLVGGALAYGAGKLIGSAREKLGDAEQEYIRYDTLKRTLGDVNVGFNALKESLRMASGNIEVTFEEGQKLATEFAKISGLSRTQYDTLSQEVNVSGGFGRSFGMDPGASNQFFAQMRQFGATDNTADTRRMALMIGEGIARSGAFSKADELMQAIAGYTAQQTRQGLTAANVSGYTGMLASMVGSGIPGLDPQGAASLLARVNSSIASGGGAGEAGQNFLYMTLGNRLGLNPIQSKLLQEQGAFGSGASAFGGDLYKRFAGRYGLGTPGASGSESTNLQMIMSQMQRSYSSQPFLMLDAMSNMFGTNMSQSMALATIDPAQLGGMSSRLGRLGKNINNISATGISTLAQIETGDSATLSSIIGSLRGRTDNPLSTEERDRLNAAVTGANQTGDDTRLRDVLAELASTREQEKTEGSETRRTIVGVQNEVQKLASAMIPAMNAMRDGILYLAGDGKMSQAEISQAIQAAEYKHKESSLRTNFEAEATTAMDAVHDASRNVIAARSARPRDPAAIKAAEEAFAAAKAKRDAIVSRFDADMAVLNGQSTPGAAPAPAAGEPTLNLTSATPGTTSAPADRLFAALIQQESGGRHYARDGSILTSPAGARGIGQIMPGTGRRPGFGIAPLKDDSEAENLRLSREYWNAMVRKYGDTRKALGAYNYGPGNMDRTLRLHGEDWFSHLPAETRNYITSVTAAGGDAMPAGSAARTGGSADINVNVSGQFDLRGPTGQPAAPPVNVMRRVNVPSPFGIQR